jgi:hypothetical protein
LQNRKRIVSQLVSYLCPEPFSAKGFRVKRRFSHRDALKPNDLRVAACVSIGPAQFDLRIAVWVHDDAPDAALELRHGATDTPQLIAATGTNKKAHSIAFSVPSSRVYPGPVWDLGK